MEALGAYDHRIIQDIPERREGSQEPFAHLGNLMFGLLGPNGVVTLACSRQEG
jgi:hypothetical protein